MSSKSAVGSMGKSKLIIAGIVALLLSMVTMWGCSANEGGAATQSTSPTSSEEAASQDQIQVQVIVKDETNTTSIDFKDYDGTVTLLEDSNVIAALEQTGLDVEEAENGPYGSFVYSIGELQNEGNNEWTYTVNGKSYDDPPANVMVTNGDVIEWTYKTVDENKTMTEHNTDNATADAADQDAPRTDTDVDGEEVQAADSNR